MLLHRRHCWQIACLVAGILGASSSIQAQSAHLTLQSQPGDFIGQGGNFDIIYTPANSVFFSAKILRSLPTGEPAYLSFLLGTVTGGSNNTFTTLDFATDQLNLPIQPGTYTDAQRAAFATPGHPGLDVTFQNRGSNTLTGNFTITDATFFQDTLGHTQINTFAVSFEQHSEGARPALFGTFAYDAGRTPAVPEPGAIALFAGLGVSSLLAVRRMRRNR